MAEYSKVNFIEKWWRQIDQSTMIAILILIIFSAMLVTTASPAVANRIGLVDNYFTTKQFLFLAIALFLIFVISSLSHYLLKAFVLTGFVLTIISLVIVKFYGHEIKGATRWINIAGFTLQPSEFVKPFFAILIGWLLSLKYIDDLPIIKICMFLYLLVATLLAIQPDFGMLVVLTSIFVIQLFVAGLPFILLLACLCGFSIIILAAYFIFPHVATRINSFLYLKVSENYQVNKSLMAFKEGGLYGKGPGEGAIKQNIPDSHTDFIFAVAGEEFGAIIAMFIIAVLAFLIIHNLLKLFKNDDAFIQIAGVGIISYIGMQAIFNIGVTLNLFPTKGMTLPLISYGGSSTIAISIALGLLMNLTKRKTSMVKYKRKDYEYI